jgi:hypothetical protein
VYSSGIRSNRSLMHNRLTPKCVLGALLSVALIVSTVSSIPAVHAVGPTGSVEFLNYTGMITSVGAVTPSGTNDFTHEMWIKPTSLLTNREEILFTTGTNRNREFSNTIGNCNSLTSGTLWQQAWIHVWTLEIKYCCSHPWNT